MLRMVFEIVMASAVVLTIVMITKLGALPNEVDSDDESRDDNSQ
ncbi:hypothetical protein [Methylomicrobium sp. Wu6]|nr:hypothetical protein [Methylomicrobium sp. Wu6]MEC4749421.1 hypothetical protein [Methylomicrobium sp. Wu6]